MTHGGAARFSLNELRKGERERERREKTLLVVAATATSSHISPLKGEGPNEGGGRINS